MKNMPDATNVKRKELDVVDWQFLVSRSDLRCDVEMCARADRISEYSDFRTTPIRIVLIQEYGTGVVAQESRQLWPSSRVYLVRRIEGWIYHENASLAVIIFLPAMKRAVVTRVTDLLRAREVFRVPVINLDCVFACAYNNSEHILQFILLWDLW